MKNNEIEETNDSNQLELFELPVDTSSLKLQKEGDSAKATAAADKEKKYYNHPEWCYQFFNDTPVPFAYPPEPGEPGNKESLKISLEPIEGGGLIFSSKGMVFKIFAREISQESLNELAKQSTKPHTQSNEPTPQL